MWEPLETFGEKVGRIRGLALDPHGRSQFLALADNGLFNVWIFRTVSVNKVGTVADAEANLDPAAGVLTWARTTHRLHGGEWDSIPAVTEHPAGDHLQPDPDTDSLLVTDASGAVRQTIPNFRPASEAWSLATFFGDLNMLLVASPAGLRLFRYFTRKGAERPRWTAGGAGAEQKHLFQAILANPDEDTPRLMYADWLDENGDAARAEFVRLQCRLDERWHTAFVAHDDPDQQRVNELQRQMESRWLAELPPLHGVHWAGFRRGFPAVRVASPATLVRFAKKVFAVAPVEAVTIEDLNEKGAAALAESPVLGRVRHLTLDRFYLARDGDGPLRRVLHAAGAAGLRSLTVRSSFLGDEGMRVVATSPHLTALEWLNVGYGAVTNATAGLLLASPALGRLRGGPFRGNGLSNGARARLKARFPNA